MPTALRPMARSLKRLRSRPVFTAIAVLSLALGVGANTAMFSVVDSIMLRSQPYADADRLVDIYLKGEGFPSEPMSYPDFEDVGRVTEDLLVGVTGTGFAVAQVNKPDGGIEMIPGELVPANNFEILGLEPALGRGFADEEDDAIGSAPVVVLSWDRWMRAYGGDPDVIGRDISMSGRAFTVIGVAPRDYRGALRGLVPEFFAPITMDGAFAPSGSDRLQSRSSHWFFVRGRLQPGVTQTELETRLASLTVDLKERERSSWDRTEGFSVVPTRGVVLNPVLDRFVLAGGSVLMALVILVLTITCANLAGFLLARASDQRKVVAIQTALGASRSRLVGEQMLDAIILSLIGGGLGMVTAAALIDFVSSRPLPVGLPLKLAASVDLRVLLFGTAATLLSAVLFGLAPALQSTRVDVAPVLKDEATGGGRNRQRLRSALVVAQVALSTLLLVAAGLFLRSVSTLQDLDPGFGSRPTALLNFGIPQSYATASERRIFVDTLVAEVEGLPEVEAVGLIDNLHLNISNTQSIRFNIDGVEPPEGSESHLADYAWADGGFFETAGVRITSGRAFDDRDRFAWSDDLTSDGAEDGTSTVTGSQATVAIVSQAFADRYFPDRPVLGQTIRRPQSRDVEIVGVAADTMVRLLGEDPRPFIYLPAEQLDTSNIALLARTGGTEENARALSARILERARALEPGLMVLESRTVGEHLGTQLLPSRALAIAFVSFSGLALVLAGIGLAGIVSYGVSARSREVGIRMSLGANGSSIIRALAGGGLKLVVTGSIVGVVLALAVTRIASSLLFRVETQDPVVFVVVPGILLAVAGIATVLPSLRALRINPTKTLRS